jgi:uracil-DNA glycosylase family 4
MTRGVSGLAAAAAFGVAGWLINVTLRLTHPDPRKKPPITTQTVKTKDSFIHHTDSDKGQCKNQASCLLWLQGHRTRRLFMQIVRALGPDPTKMAAMSDPYQDLLEATIDHLQNLKAEGIRFLSASSETLTFLNSPHSPALRKTSAEVSKPAPVQKTILPADHGIRKPAQLQPLADVRLPMETPTSAPPPLTSEAKTSAFAELLTRAQACVKCSHLVASRKNVVFGVGNINSDLMFVGEAPGADEDQQAEPFVGKAGQLLTKIIQTMGLSRQTVYIANILKCRPDTPGQTAGNRKPTPEEMQTCIPYLHEQIDLIRPRVLVALGATAVEGLLGKTAGITRLRGTWHTYRGIPLMPTYHPAFLLRNQALSEKRKVWEDMLQVMERLGMAISEKQRGFFLKG